MGSSLQENDTKIHSNLQQVQEPSYQISKSLSEDKISPLETLSDSQQ
jgi:hypothetical protein